MLGKEYLSPRLVTFYANKGVDYKYSGVTHRENGIPKSLFEVINKIESFSGYTFNSVLINYYRNDKDSMGWHSDDEKELGPEPVIRMFECGVSYQYRFYKN